MNKEMVNRKTENPNEQLKLQRCKLKEDFKHLLDRDAAIRALNLRR